MRARPGLRGAALLLLPGLFLGCSVLLDFDRLEHGDDAGVGDLAGADLTGVDLAGTAPDLTGLDLAGLDLTGLDLSNVCPSFPAAGVAFTADETNVTGAQVFAIGVGDFNEDGRPDFIAGTNGAGAYVEVHLKAASGRAFSSGAVTNSGCTGAPYLYTTLVGYFDADAHLDVITHCFDLNGTGPSNLYLLSGDGQGGFGSPVAFTSLRRVEEPIAADVDGDGHTDLVAIDRTANGIAIYWGGPAMTSGTPEVHVTGADASQIAVRAIAPGQLPAIGVAHIDGTTADMATDPSHFTLLRQTAARTFAAPVREDFVNGINGVAFGRFDSDGYVDALLTSNDGPLLLKKGKADGTLANASAAGSAPLHQQHVTAADLDCDGIDDVAMSHFQTFSGPEANWDVVTVRKGNASGIFGSVTTPTFPDGSAPNETGIADFDGDGRPDIAVAVIGTPNRVRILWSNPP